MTTTVTNKKEIKLDDHYWKWESWHEKVPISKFHHDVRIEHRLAAFTDEFNDARFHQDGLETAVHGTTHDLVQQEVNQTATQHTPHTLL